MFYFFISILLKSLILIIFLLVAVAFFTVLERKLIASVQRRRGPNIVGTFGLLQAGADGAKLLIKETVIPSSSNVIIFVLSPIFTFIVALMGWVIVPFGEGSVLANIDLGILYFFAVSSLGVYTIIMAGWSSNSKYAFLGALRSAAQMISYEVAIGFTIITIFLCCGSLNLTEIVRAQETVWYAVPLFPMFIIFFISALAETNRHPFDLPEAEAELVSGYNVEYSAMGFALFFLGEYGNILLMSTTTAILFLGGWLPPFAFLNFIPGWIWLGLKVGIFAVLFVIIRAVLPRYRYDQLMQIGWKIFIPVTLGWLILIAGLLIGFNSLPDFIYF
jgi:NADH-quinone oxidoreductase subunit H